MFENLGLALKLLRERKGKSQRQLAAETGIGKSQLCKYENGKELPKLNSLARLLEALDVGYEGFFSTLGLIDRAVQGLAVGVLPLSELPSLALEDADEAFSQVLKSVVVLHHACAANRLLLLDLTKLGGHGGT